MQILWSKGAERVARAAKYIFHLKCSKQTLSVEQVFTTTFVCYLDPKPPCFPFSLDYICNMAYFYLSNT